MGCRSWKIDLRLRGSNEDREAGVFAAEGSELFLDLDEWAPDSLGSSPSGKGVTGRRQVNATVRRDEKAQER